MELSKENVLKNINEAVSSINVYSNKCLSSDNKHLKKINLISYWLKDYVKYIDEEENFNSLKLKKYSRGDIIKANLGFNIGNEEGGLHYCVVLDKTNSKLHSTLTVIPLSSFKSNKKLNKSCVFLGNELYDQVTRKAKTLINSFDMGRINECQNKVVAFSNGDVETLDMDAYSHYKEAVAKIRLLEKIIEEMKQMKKGTIALVNQITTISKQRIYNPKKDFDVLSNVKLSDASMDLINEKLKKFYII